MPAKIDSKDYIDELLYNIKSKDSIKAKILLRHIDEVDEGSQRRLIFELSRTDDEFSVPLLASLISENPAVAERVPSLKQVLISKFLDDPSEMLSFLRNPETPNIEVFIEIAGEIQSEESVHLLVQLLNDNRDSAFIITTLRALGNIASSKATNPITDFLYSNDRNIIVSAIDALKKIATPAAVCRLHERMDTDNQLDLIIIDALAEIQDNASLEKLNETLLSHNAFIRNYGKTKLIEIGQKAVPVLIANLNQDDPDLLIHTLNALGSIGDKSATTQIRKLLFNAPSDPNVRFAAYEALGMLPVDKDAYILAGGLSDPVDNVCAAAAKAINKNYNSILSAGIRNILSDSNSDFKKLVHTIIDSEAGNIFMDLISEDFFRKYATAYIKNKAHKDVRKFFHELLLEKGMPEIAAEIEQKTAAGRKKKVKRICVVDDSRMILSVYRKTLHNLGYESELNEFPASALENIMKEKPDLLITDLNMPDITGIELLLEVRKKYSPKELPAVMVTTQNEKQDNEAAKNAGVNRIMQKPFTEETLGKVIEELLK